MAFFSVIITVYNKEKHIEATLLSVINQSFKDFEIIIVNDGSTDQSLQKIKSFTDNRISIINTANQGASAARNLGIKSANSQFVALLDGDDIWKVDYLKCMYEAIKKFPKESVFTCAIALKYDKHIVPAKYSFNQIKHVEVRDYFKSSLKHTALTSSSIIFRKECIQNTGWFDPTIISGQDTDMWIRIGLNYPIVFIDDILVHYTYDSKSLSNISLDPSKKPRYDKYTVEETNNYHLKRFLDRNRYAMALKSKLYDDKSMFRFYMDSLSLKNLSMKERLLLFSPKWLLNVLLKLKSLKGEKLYYRPLK